MKTGAVIQARMGSTRLPGKVMLPLQGPSVLDHVLARVAQCTRLDEIVVATTTLRQDDVIAARAAGHGVTCFRGSVDDLLARYYHTARASGLDVVVRITADCPLIDPFVTDEVVGRFLEGGWDIVTNAGDAPGERTYPRGLDTEVFSFAALAEAFERARAAYQREHVTPYLYETKRVYVHRHPVDYSRHRWTLDTEDDYRLLREIYARLYRGRHDFYFMDIVDLVERTPWLASINAHVEQRRARPDAEEGAGGDFDARLERLLDAHGVRPQGSRRSRLQEAVAARWRAIPRDTPILLWGDAEHTAELLNLVREDPRTIVGVVDGGAGEPGEVTHGHRRVTPEGVDGRDVGLVVVSSHRNRTDIKAEARRRFPGHAILDFYDALEARAEFAERRGFPFYSCAEYVRLSELKEAYEGAAEPEARRRALFDLVALYFEVRDFVHAFAYAQAWVAGGHDAEGRVARCLADVRALLDELKGRLQRRERDVALFLVDALRPKDVVPDEGTAAGMPFLAGFAKTAVTFANAFSPTLYTLPGIPAMLTGRLPLDDGLYARRSLRVDESALLSALHARGYRLANFVSWKNFFTGDDRVAAVRVRAPGDVVPLLSRGVVPRLLWALACRLAVDASAPAFSLVHMFYETHDPHVCGYHERPPVHHLFYEYLADPGHGMTKERYRRQLMECLRYVDAQLEFYFDLLPERMLKVVFSDHGQAAERILDRPEEVGSLLSWHDERIRVVLMVHVPGTPGFTHTGLFSMLDLGALVRGAVEGTVTIPQRAYVPVQCEPIYNPRIREIFASIGCGKYAKGFKALRGDRDKYVLYHDGAEEYYLLPDERNDRARAAEAGADLARIRAALPDRTFPDFGAR
jgi:spore coat polysaccharide biosynthesis protein SpsF